MNQLVQQVKNSVVTHMPGILTGIGIASFGTSVISAATATPKALAMLEKKKREKKDDLEPVEMVEATWKCYIPSVVMFSIGVGCTIGGLKVSERRGAAWATAYTLSETAFREYQDKIVEKIGEKKEKQARDEIAQEKINADPPKNIDVVQTGRGDVLCKDLATERLFTVDIDDIYRAEDYVKKELGNPYNYDERRYSKGSCSWNEFYEQLHLGPTELGYELGWNRNKPLEKIIVSSCLHTDGSPILAIDYKPRPYAEFWNVD